MNKTKIDVYKEVFIDVSENFEGAENFIKQWIEEICEQKKISVKVVIYFYIILMLLVL